MAYKKTQTMKPFCSIIIPIYNEEKNLAPCFERISKQKYKSIEIIFIDDGSTDSSPEIIKNIISSNPDRKIIYKYQANGGAAKARKLGIDIASHEYIAFLDCDDQIDDNTIELAMNEFNNPSIDFSLFSLKYVDCKENIEKNSLFPYYTNSKIISGYDAFLNCIDSWGLHGFGIIKKNIILDAYSIYLSKNTENTNFINNDEVISRLCFYKSKFIAKSDGSYYFINNTESTTRRINGNYHLVINNAIIFNQIINDLCKNKDLNKKSMRLVSKTTWGVFRRYIAWKDKINNRANWINTIENSIKYYHSNKKNGNAIESMKIAFIYFSLKFKNTSSKIC